MFVVKWENLLFVLYFNIVSNYLIYIFLRINFSIFKISNNIRLIKIFNYLENFVYLKFNETK